MQRLGKNFVREATSFGPGARTDAVARGCPSFVLMDVLS